MMRPLGLTATALTLCLLAGCTPATTTLTAQARVEDTLVTLSAPMVGWPQIDLDAGFADTATSPLRIPSSPPGMRIANLSVAVGDLVQAGQQIGSLDPASLQAAVTMAERTAAVATARVGVIDEAISTTKKKSAEITDARAEVERVIDDLTRARATLRRNRTEAASTRSRLIAQRAALQAALDKLPPATTPLPPSDPGAPPLPDRSQLSAAIAKLSAGITRLDAGVKKLDAGLKKLDTGLATALNGKAKLAEAAATITDARAELVKARRLAIVAADTAAVTVDTASVQAEEAVLIAPAGGRVVEAAQAGEVITPGAPLLRIREPATTLTTWLTPAELGRTCAGAVAALDADWLTNPATATITVIGVAAEFPPTSQATQEIHLTRAVRVSLTADAPLPPGLALTVVLPPCAEASAR